MHPLRSILPNTPLAELVEMECTRDEDPDALKIINDVETRLTKTLGWNTRGYSVGESPLVFSRRERSKYPQYDHLAAKWLIKRYLDKPEITKWLIEITIAHTKNCLQDLLQENPTHSISGAQLPHKKNAAKHLGQPATLLSYLNRTFCPDDMPRLTPNPEIEISDEVIKRIITSLPIDPNKISDTVLLKMGLTPHDFESYTLQARLRYKLWIRKRFLAILSEAHVFERVPTETAKGKTTARIMCFKTEEDEWKFATYATSTKKHDHITWKTKLRTHKAKVSNTSFTVLEDMGTLIRSQEHILKQLLLKGEEVEEFLALFENYRNMTRETRIEFVSEALTYFFQKHGYYGEKIVDDLIKLPKSPTLVGNIRTNLRKLQKSIKGKAREINTVYELLLAKWDKI